MWEKLDVIDKRHIDKARQQGSGYPGPQEAKAIMKEIEKSRWHVTAHRLRVLV